MNSLPSIFVFALFLGFAGYTSAQHNNARVLHFGTHRTFFIEGHNNFNLFFPNYENWAADQSSGLQADPFLEQQGINTDLTWIHQSMTYSAELRFAWTNFNYAAFVGSNMRREWTDLNYHHRSIAQRFHVGYQVQQLFKKRKVNKQNIVSPSAQRAWHQNLIIEPRLVFGLLSSYYSVQYAEVDDDQVVMRYYDGDQKTLEAAFEFRTGYQFAQKISLVAVGGFQQADFRYTPFHFVRDPLFTDDPIAGNGSDYVPRENHSGFYAQFLVGVQF